MVDTLRRGLLQPRVDAAKEAELWEAVRAEIAALVDDHDDGYYSQRLEQGLILESYEEAVLAYLREAVAPENAHVVEIGAGWGPLCIALAALGYRVTAFNGEGVHLSAMRRVVDAAARSIPEVGRNVEVRRGFFPYALTRDDVARQGSVAVLVGTNIINEVNRSSQDAILAAAAQFDRFLVDVATFAYDRDASEREQLKALLAPGFSTRGAVWENRLIDLQPRPGVLPWSGARPPMPDWLSAAPHAAGGVGTLDLVDVWPTLAAREGHCWTLRLPPGYEGLSDTMDAPRRSPFRLTEDGALLGPPHAIHDDVARLGGGRYSHWGDSLLFSTSDGSHPGTDGRRYRLVRSVFDAAAVG